ncbi:MAG: RNA 3'-terminal phosphate cyclase [Anaeromyxobacteraceae bacterium]
MGARPLIDLDGAQGEGGGQILRSALALSAVTGAPFRISRVRHGRAKPGLRPQHLSAARAMAELCQADLEGASVGSDHILFAPRQVATPGVRAFDIGTAGSAPLLFQTLCWPLALAGGASELTLRGGTHQGGSPSFHYLALVWAPAMARMGFAFDLCLQVAGFYPEGGGELTARIHPARAMPPLDLLHRGTLLEAEALSLVAGQPFEVAERLASRAERRLRDCGVAAAARAVPLPTGPSRGSHLIVVARFERTVSGHGATGDRGEAPERVADDAAADFSRFLDGQAAVDLHMGDQLLVPAALVASGRAPRPEGVGRVTRYSVSEVTRHLSTNADVVRAFLPVEVEIDGTEGGPGTIVVRPRA